MGPYLLAIEPVERVQFCDNRKKIRVYGRLITKAASTKSFGRKA